MVVARFKAFSGWAGVLALALIVIPVVIRTTENMLLPGAQRAARGGLCARRAEVEGDHRHAEGRAPGVITGILLAVARIAGETDAAAVHRAVQPVLDHVAVGPMASLPVTIFKFAMSPYENWQKLAWAGVFLITHGRADAQHPGPRVLPQEQTRSWTPKSNSPSPSAPRWPVRDLNFFYGKFHALKNINLDIPRSKVTAFIGPSGCGKSTLLRVLQPHVRALYPEQRAEGEILLDGENILQQGDDVSLIRAKVGMVFQKPTPFPMSIYDNIAFGVRLFENLPRAEMDERVEWALKKAALWTEVKGQAAPERLGPLRRPAAAPVHRAASPSSPRCCCSTSPARRSTRSPPARSKS